MDTDKLHALLRYAGWREISSGIPSNEDPWEKSGREILWADIEESVFHWLLLDPDGPGAKLRAAGWELDFGTHGITDKWWVMLTKDAAGTEADSADLLTAIVDAFTEAAGL